MNKSQQFILSEHLEDIKDALEFTKFLVTEKADTLTLQEVFELSRVKISLDESIFRIEKIIQN